MEKIMAFDDDEPIEGYAEDVKEEEKNLCEFAVIKKKCYFCDQPRTIQFNEHFTFCPNCSSIYSKQILQKSHCKHFSGDQAIVIKLEPCYSEDRDKPYITEGDTCSICGANVWAGGW